jgi:hypothetical protein
MSPRNVLMDSSCATEMPDLRQSIPKSGRSGANVPRCRDFRYFLRMHEKAANPSPGAAGIPARSGRPVNERNNLIVGYFK